MEEQNILDFQEPSFLLFAISLRCASRMPLPSGLGNRINFHKTVDSKLLSFTT